MRPGQLYTAFYLGQFLFLGVQLPFLPGWLDSEGFSEPAIGWLTGGALILRLLLGPMIAYWAEGQKDQRLVLFLISGTMALSAGLLVFQQPAWSISILIILSMWSFGCLVPLTDTAVIRADKAGQINYGKARGLGSAAFIVGNLVGGILIGQFGDQVVIFWLAGASALTFLVSARLPQERPTPANGVPLTPPVRPAFDLALRLFRSRSFVLLLIAAGMAQGAHAAYYYFSELHWSSLGYGSELIGILWTVGVLAEIGVLYAGRHFIKRFGPVTLMSLGAIASIIRWPLTGLSPPLPILIILQMLHALTFAATYLGSVEFVARAIPNNLTSTGMTLISTLGVGALTGLGAIMVGLVFTPQAPFIGYTLMAGMGTISLGACILLARHWDGGIIRTEREFIKKH